MALWRAKRRQSPSRAGTCRNWQRDAPVEGKTLPIPQPGRDLSGPYRAAYAATVPCARQVADPLHVVRVH